MRVKVNFFYHFVLDVALLGVIRVRIRPGLLFYTTSVP